jgi:hypothetical protein
MCVTFVPRCGDAMEGCAYVWHCVGVLSVLELVDEEVDEGYMPQKK